MRSLGDDLRAATLAAEDEEDAAKRIVREMPSNGSPNILALAVAMKMAEMPQEMRPLDFFLGLLVPALMVHARMPLDEIRRAMEEA